MWVLASGVVDSRVEEVHGDLPEVIVIADMVKVGPTCKCAAARMDFRGRRRWWLIVLVWYCPWITVLGAKHDVPSWCIGSGRGAKIISPDGTVIIYVNEFRNSGRKGVLAK
jgi:hypothetical protein